MPKKEEKVLPEESLLKLARITEQNVEASRKVVDRVDKLVTLFEEASKHVSDVETTEAKMRALSAKLEELLEQNKTIAQGLLLLEKYVRGKSGLETRQGPKQVAEYGTN